MEIEYILIFSLISFVLYTKLFSQVKLSNRNIKRKASRLQINRYSLIMLLAILQLYISESFLIMNAIFIIIALYLLREKNELS